MAKNLTLTSVSFNTFRVFSLCVILWSSVSAEYERKAITLDLVAEEAKQLLETGERSKSPKLPRQLKELDYDGYRNIRYRPSEALWADQASAFRVEFFHLGHIFDQTVTLFEHTDTHVQKIPFMEDAFDYRQSAYEPQLFRAPPGYAGIRVKYPLNREDVWDDLIVFQGASYFRALGKGHNYGLSLRALSMGTTEKETFPRFTKLWLKKPLPNENTLTIHALLEGEAVTGAYRFIVHPQGQTKIDVEARLFFAEGANRSAGIAPITSMFVFGENSNHRPNDWRPEVHDSDGLLIKGDGEWIWRPLENLPGRYVKKYSIARLDGFGLLQRDLDFGSYEDLESNYHLRPSAWITPVGEWPLGDVVLYTFGTDTEATDNITAFWAPRFSSDAAQELDIAYTISIQFQDPQDRYARVVSTRVGQRTMDASATTIAIDFEVPDGFSGDQIDTLDVDFDAGAAEMMGHPIVQYSSADEQIRVFANFKNPTSALDAPYEMSALLLKDGHVMSELWNYAWRP